MDSLTEQNQSAVDEQHLLTRLKNGEPSAQRQFSNWLEAQRAWLSRRCLSRLSNTADADEAVQDALLRAWRGVHRFEGRSSLKTWLSRIADNQCYSQYRLASRHQLTEHVIETIAAFEQERRLETDNDKLEISAAVTELLTTLNEKTQTVLRLRFIEERSLQEIADETGVGLSAVKMRLYRGLSELRAHIDADDKFFA